MPAIRSHTVYPDDQLADRIEDHADELGVSISEYYKAAARNRLAEREN